MKMDEDDVTEPALSPLRQAVDAEARPGSHPRPRHCVVVKFGQARWEGLPITARQSS